MTLVEEKRQKELQGKGTFFSKFSTFGRAKV